jgi:hypothetical protein
VVPCFSQHTGHTTVRRQRNSNETATKRQRNGNETATKPTCDVELRCVQSVCAMGLSDRCAGGVRTPLPNPQKNSRCVQCALHCTGDRCTAKSGPPLPAFVHQLTASLKHYRRQSSYGCKTDLAHATTRALKPNSSQLVAARRDALMVYCGSCRTFSSFVLPSVCRGSHRPTVRGRPT